MADPQRTVQALLDELVETDAERGLQVAAYLDGELVIDTWSGLADPATGRLVTGETLFTVFSVSKGITATIVHQCAERGLLDYDTPIAAYWPEFGIAGKEGITVRQALAHTAGVPHLPTTIQAADLCDWAGICQTIAAETPLWSPGTQTGYHALTYGWLLGEVVRRVTGKPIAELVQTEICAPLGISDIYFGIPDEVEARVATMETDPHPAPFPPIPPDALINRAIPLSIQPLADFANNPQVRRASIPAGGGIMTARAIARHYAALAGGPHAGVQLLSPERIAIATTLQTEQTDLALGTPGRKALGYALGQALSPRSERITAFGHSGAGGAEGYADPQYHFALGFAKNRMVTNLPGEGSTYRIATTVRAALGIPEA